jgi:hypothetical protein
LSFAQSSRRAIRRSRLTPMKSEMGSQWIFFAAELDMKTLVWTRGEQFPLDQLESRLKCPRCGQRRVTVMFDIPNRPQALRQ